jgi:hypothetical protein
MRRDLPILCAALCLLGATGCNPEMHPNPDMDTSGHSGNMPLVLKYAGIYQANASIDLTQNGVLPGQLSPILDAISELHDEPGKALIDIVIASDVPQVSEALKELPSWVLTLLRDLLSETIKTFLYANNPNIDKLAKLAQDITQITQSSVIKTQLTIHTPDQNGAIKVDQKVSAMAFQLLGGSVDVPTPLSARAAAATQMTGTLQARSTTAADASISFSGGKVVLPVGDFVLESLGPLLFRPLSGQETLGQALIALIDCAAIGDAVSGSVDNPISVGHDLVVGVCQFGLSAIAAAVEDELHRLILSDVGITNASALLYDVSPSHPTADHQSDRVAEGTWTWSIGSSDIPSTFSGERIGVTY